MVLLSAQTFFSRLPTTPFGQKRDGNTTHDPIRKWLTDQVLPALRDRHVPAFNNAPIPALLQSQHSTLSVMHWQHELWIGFKDTPCLIHTRKQETGWWGKIRRGLPGR
ncbi:MULTISPECIES: hypothetical protein [unclassified Pseudomonas]|uniref:hypothetical protein n=1 Tax=unclassified Pseudomonas TaxID=196821 RepID=UPI0025DF217C|nr:MULTISPECIES: hypothetical protein [unclassified Pseudomonas]